MGKKKNQKADPIQPETKETRHNLMLKAKERGIKNFRVLNKKELESVLVESASQEQINKVVSGAVTRWKSGWGKRKDKITKK